MHRAGDPTSEAVESAAGAPTQEPRRLIVVNHFAVREVVRASVALLAVIVGAYLLWLLSKEILNFGTSALRVTVDAFSVFVMAYYWLVERPTIKRAVLRAVPPPQARRVNTVWVEVEQKLGGWVRGQLLVMVCTGAIAGTGFL